MDATTVRALYNSTTIALDVLNQESTQNHFTLNPGDLKPSNFLVPWIASPDDVERKAIRVSANGELLYYIWQEYRTDDGARIRYGKSNENSQPSSGVSESGSAIAIKFMQSVPDSISESDLLAAPTWPVLSR